MKCFITGGAGFIGSNLVDGLIKEHEITVFDNLSLGKKEFIEHHLQNEKFNFIKADLLDFKKLKESVKDHDVVFHLAANSDISNNQITDIDFKNGTIATYNVLESMRLNNIKQIIFSSTSAVYGEAKIKPTQEDYGPLFPISHYGASKLAAEALISAFCHNFMMKSWIFRFANIVGKNSTHGAVFDFINKLRNNNERLHILGDGSQAKPYLHVKDCVSGMVFGWKNSNDEINYFNLGCEGATKVSDIAKMVIKEMKLKNVKLEYTGKERGWPGDVPQVRLDISKINKLGWKTKLSSDQAVRMAIKDLLKKASY